METSRRPPRPKKWTMQVIGTVKFLHDDRIEQLLNFRAEYRQKLKISRIRADHFARTEAIRMALYAARELLIGAIIFGKRVFSAE